jgi:hypothetical protein
MVRYQEDEKMCDLLRAQKTLGDIKWLKTQGAKFVIDYENFGDKEPRYINECIQQLEDFVLEIKNS